jgi:ribonuclease E
MLIDATHPEETRVVVVDGNKLDDFDFETAAKKQLKGNIYLARVTRVEPSLQAAFVEYGGNRHGFLAFSEIHPDYYRIPIEDREALLREEQAYHDEDDDEIEDDVGEVDVAEEPAAEDDGAEDEGADDAETGENGGADDIVDHAADGETGEATAESETEAASDPAPAADDGDSEDGAADQPAGSGDEAEVDGDETVDAAGSSEDGEDVPARAQAAEVSVQTRKSAKPETVGGDAMEEVRRRRKPSNRRYKIQEVVARRQIMLVQVVKEERGNKGAALTTYLSLAGRYCVLMPNTARGGGVSRKITHAGDRKRLKQIVEGLDVPEGMAVIVRTAGSQRTKAEIKRDYEYLLRLWDEIRQTTLESQAPCLIYEEANLIKRSIRDLYTRDLDEVLVDGDDGYRIAKDFMKTLIPSHAKRVKRYKDGHVPLLHRYQVESQLDAIHSPTVELKSGGYIVINQTEALVAIDVNSGRSTSERNIEETALKTNLEAADEVARQLRLRDLAGLVVIDFIDMEESRNQHAVERRIKEAMKSDRARIQIGRISHFGLMELSRQRLRPSLVEASTQVCPHCKGSGHIRSIDSTALHILRVIEEEGLRNRAAEIAVHVPAQVALYILNHKRDRLAEIELRYGIRVLLEQDDSLVPPDHRMERLRPKTSSERAVFQNAIATGAVTEAEEADDDIDEEEDEVEAREEQDERRGRGRSRRRRRGGRRRSEDRSEEREDQERSEEDGDESADEDERSERPDDAAEDGSDEPKRRRRGRRGGRRRSRRRRDGEEGAETTAEEGAAEDDLTEDDQAEDSQPEDARAEDAPAGEEAAVAIAGDDVAGDDADDDGVTVADASDGDAPDGDGVTAVAASSDGVAEVAATVEAEPVAADPTAEEPAAKPKRPRRRRKAEADSEAAVAEPQPTEPVVETPAEPQADTVADTETVEAANADAPADDDASDAISGEPGEDETASEDVAEDSKAVGEERAAISSVPIEVRTLDKPVEKPRKGWWRR